MKAKLYPERPQQKRVAERLLRWKPARLFRKGGCAVERPSGQLLSAFGWGVQLSAQILTAAGIPTWAERVAGPDQSWSHHLSEALSSGSRLYNLLGPGSKEQYNYVIFQVTKRSAVVCIHSTLSFGPRGILVGKESWRRGVIVRAVRERLCMRVPTCKRACRGKCWHREGVFHEVAHVSN